MAQSRTSWHGKLRRILTFAFCAALVVGVGCIAHGGVAVAPVIEASPLIAKGHLEGGVNGEGSHRPDGKTPLMLAAEADNVEVADYLLDHGADLDLTDAAGETALDLAQRSHSQAVAEMLQAQAAAHPGFSAFYSDESPVLTAVSATSQSGAPDRAPLHPIVVSVADHDGNPLVDAPIRFTVDGGGKNLLTEASSPDSASLLLRSDSTGQCRANLHLPKEPNTRIHITASAGTGEQTTKVTFTALSNDGTGSSPSCYDPTDVQATLLPKGDVSVSWHNNTKDETAIKVWIQLPEGWKLALTLPPHSSSAHIPANP